MASSPSTPSVSEKEALQLPTGPDGICRVVLCGAGASVHTLAARLGSQKGVRVRVFSTYERDGKPEVADWGTHVQVSEDCGDTYKVAKLDMVTNDPGRALPGANVIILSLPANAHREYLELINKHISPADADGLVIGLLPAQCGADLEFRHVLSAELRAKAIIFALDTLPWICEVREYGVEAAVLGLRTEVSVAIEPYPKIKEAVQHIRRLFGSVNLRPTTSMLAITLSSVSCIMHPVLTFGRFRPERWSGSSFKRPPLFYESCDDFTAETLEAVWAEVLALKAAFVARFDGLDLEDVVNIDTWIMRHHAGKFRDNRSLRSLITTNAALAGVSFPMLGKTPDLMPNFHYRYLTEDVPFGLCVLKGFAELLDVPTPVMDRVIVWAQEKIGKSYLVDGVLSGPDVAETRAPQRYGLTDVDSLMAHTDYL